MIVAVDEHLLRLVRCDDGTGERHGFLPQRPIAPCRDPQCPEEVRPVTPSQGPAINPMIKVINLVAVIVAPIVVQYKTLGVIGWLVVLVLVAIFAWSIWKSKGKAPELADMEPDTAAKPFSASE